MSEELDVLKSVSQRLEKAKILYMVSGSMAANYYTVPRMTRDIDVVIQMQATDTPRFIEAFKQDFFIDEDVVNSEVKAGGMFNVIHKECVIKIDFILGKNSEFQEMSFTRRKKAVIENTAVWLISLEDLILAKLLWVKDSFSELQIKDVRNLIQTNPGLDWKYLEKWVGQLGLDSIYQKARHE